MKSHRFVFIVLISILVAVFPGAVVAQDGDGGTTAEAGSEPGADGGSEQPSAGTAAQFGFGVESIQMSGETWTRIHFFPVFPLWKFQFAFDLELFIDGEGNLSNKGWNFASVDAALDSIVRKIYYLGFNTKPNVVSGDDHFYIRVGALPSVTLGLGVIMDNYTNTLEYPLEKKIGVDMALGNLTALNFGIEAVAPDVTDFARGGGVVGGRLFFSPLGFTKIPLLNKLQIGATYVADINQYGGLKDSDGDGYPDEVDRFPTDPDLARDTDGDGVADQNDTDADGDQVPDFSDLTESEKQDLADYLLATYGLEDQVDKEVTTEDLFSLAGKKDYFSMIGADIIIPIFPFLSLYTQYAQTLDLDTTTPVEGWGLSGPGIKLDLGRFLSIDVGYRRIQGQFAFGYFNQNYDNQRAVVQDATTVLTKSETLTADTLNGVYGSVRGDLYIIWLSGAYEHLLPESGGDPQISFEARAGLNEERLSNIPILSEYLAGFSAYFTRDTVNSIDKLFTPNPSVLMGADLDISFGGMLVTYSVSRTYDQDGTPVDTMSVGTSASF